MTTMTEVDRFTIRARPRRQRGAALLTAMIIVTLVATLAAAMVWQQWRAVQVESAERARTQSAWILSGALDFARLILREDWRSKKPTALTEPWATPLAEARLSTFLAVDKSNADDGPEAFLSGFIIDAQSRYNLRNLYTLDKDAAARQLAILGRICEAAGVDSSVATLIARGLNDAYSPSNTNAAAPLQPINIAQLRWLGIDAATVQSLRPYVVLLKTATPVNVNTASAEVLAAVIDTDPATAERLVQTRQRTPFKNTKDFIDQAGSGAQAAADSLTVLSEYFIVTGRLRLVDRVLVERSTLHRLPTNGSSVVDDRERVASVDLAGG